MVSAVGHTEPAEMWGSAYDQAAALGCSFPGEPAGDGLRTLIRAGALLSEPSIRTSVGEAVMACDACGPYCTVSKEAS